jgi:vacuolar-type H+-ATPase subunit C/Vma6
VKGGYEALATKAKAMYGKRLRHADYVRMAAMGSVKEIYADLRQHPVWGGAMGRVDEDNGIYHRAQLEGALREQIRLEYIRLSAFVPQSDRALMEFPVLRSELDGLLFTLTRLQAGRIKEVEPLPTAFIRHSKTDERALPLCTDYDGLLEAAKESIYYDALLHLRPADGGLPDYTVTESLLFSVYYSHVMKVIQKRYEGDVKRTLEKSVGSQVDMINIMHVLRLKHFFPETDNFLTVLLPTSYRLRPEQIRDMCAAQGPDGVLAVVDNTPYAQVFRGASVAQLQRLYVEARGKLNRRQLMMGKPSVYSAVAFLDLREMEMKELITVIETVKYQAKYDDSIARSLGC